MPDESKRTEYVIQFYHDCEGLYFEWRDAAVCARFASLERCRAEFDNMFEPDEPDEDRSKGRIVRRDIVETVVEPKPPGEQA